MTTKTQPNGGEYTYTYDAVHRLTGITTLLGYETTFTYSTGDDLLTEKDSLRRDEYDLMGNSTQMTVTNGKEKVVENHKYTYNDSNQLMTEYFLEKEVLSNGYK